MSVGPSAVICCGGFAEAVRTSIKKNKNKQVEWEDTRQSSKVFLCTFYVYLLVLSMSLLCNNGAGKYVLSIYFPLKVKHVKKHSLSSMTI